MKTTQKITIMASLIAASMPVHSELSYSFISADYAIATVEIDGVNDDLEGDTVSFDLSFDIANAIAIIGGYTTGSADISGNGNTIDMDVDGFYIGGVFHSSMTDSADFFVGARYLDLTADFSLNGSFVSSEDGDGHGIFFGIRGMATPQLELNAIIERSEFEDDSDTDISFGVGYYLSPTFSLDAGYLFDSDSTSLSFGATKYF